jgi:hypothetical protein
MSSGFYPSEPGIEEGETCWRAYGCRDRICYAEPECPGCDDEDCEGHEGFLYCPSGHWTSHE